MSLIALDDCIRGSTEHLGACERHCGRAVCFNYVAAQEALAPTGSASLDNFGSNAPAIAPQAPSAAATPILHRLLRWYRIRRAAQHLRHLETYLRHCERGGNCTAAELQAERLRVHDARIALAMAHGSAR